MHPNPELPLFPPRLVTPGTGSKNKETSSVFSVTLVRLPKQAEEGGGLSETLKGAKTDYVGRGKTHVSTRQMETGHKQVIRERGD